MDPVAFISRFVHVLSAIVMLGGAAYVLLILMPSARDLPEEAHAGLRERTSKRWRQVVTAGIALLLLTGFYNYLVVTRPQHDGDGAYHMLMGIKILLAFVVFFLASALVGRSQGLAWIRHDAKKWLSVLVALATLVVAIASFLKVRGEPPQGIQPSAAASLPAES